MSWITDKKLSEFSEDFFKDIDMSCLTFLDSINKDEKHNVYAYLYETFHNYNLIYDEALEKKKIELRIWEQADRLNHLYETTQYEYNPIWNVDGTETTERDVTNTDTMEKSTGFTNTRTHDLTEGNTGTDKRTDALQSQRTDNLTENTTETGTDTITHTGTDNTTSSGSSDSKTQDYPMNGTAKDREHVSATKNGTNNNTKNLTDTDTKNLSTEVKNTGTETVSNTGTVTTENTETRTTTGTVKDDNSGTENATNNGTVKEKIVHTRSGNIGVTMTQQLIEAERRIILLMYTQLVLTIEDFFFLDM